ncbi:hypothetical protein EHQ53_09800 [Leptospira langatensis]|uniref:Lipoprotein n=1 Tax=Leptospira langatensis TaxID=2484983 RepID=A0A5F1ZSS0_9LEPT|nr:hypothetical protein [Leptospira langatensis]TGK00270.1 hypothetical protein EHO57_13390 [Leptospira langatensis]TGL41095.1 hypothetical protein EHQ53_09800 [Leptospira langatensis]
MRVFLLLPLFLFSCIRMGYAPNQAFIRTGVSWDKKQGTPEPFELRHAAFEVKAWEIRGDKLKQVLEDPNNNSIPGKENKSLLDPALGWKPGEKRVFLIQIRSNYLERPMDKVGEIGVRLEHCDAKDKLEYPYTYYIFPTQLGEDKDRVSKYKQEHSKTSSPLVSREQSAYEEESRNILATFKNSCFKDGKNTLEVQILDLEFYTYRFFFEY